MTHVVFASQGPDFEPSSAPFRLIRNYAQLNPALRDAVRFSHFSVPALSRRHPRFMAQATALAEQIAAMQPDVLALSLYCWNSATLLEIGRWVGQLRPGVTVVIGGPDTDGRGDELLDANPHVDFVIGAEGEASFRRLLEHLCLESTPTRGLVQLGMHGLAAVPFLTYREEGRARRSSNRDFIQDLDVIPSPILGEPASALRTRFYRADAQAVIVETSRGCPVNCAFCQFPKSNDGKMRYFGIERVLAELRHIKSVGIESVYFGDGILTLRKERAAEIFRFFLEEFTTGTLHTEIKLDILPETLWEPVRELLAQQRLTLGIGVQSVNPQTLKRMGRTTRFNRLERVLPALQSKNTNMRWDLIYGLPNDRFRDLLDGFEYINGLTPGTVVALQRLQVLPGTRYRELADEFRLIYDSEPPYLAVRSDTFTPRDMEKAQLLDKLVEVVRPAIRAAHASLGPVLSGLYLEVFGDDLAFDGIEQDPERVFHRLLWSLRDAIVRRAVAAGADPRLLMQCYEWSVVQWLRATPSALGHPMWGTFSELTTLVSRQEAQEMGPQARVRLRPLVDSGKLFRFDYDFGDGGVPAEETVFVLLVPPVGATLPSDLVDVLRALERPRTATELHQALAQGDPAWLTVSEEELLDALDDCERSTGLVAVSHHAARPLHPLRTEAPDAASQSSAR